MSPELEADIRGRAKFQRETDFVGDSFRRAVADREELLAELDRIRAHAEEIRAARSRGYAGHGRIPLTDKALEDLLEAIG